MASVKVAVRVRPINQREKELSSHGVVRVESSTQVRLLSANVNVKSEHAFAFDHVYGSNKANGDDQERVYLDLGTDVVNNAFDGYNACVFAYGQTGSGKTHTMMGTQSNPGLIPRICEALFEKMKIDESSSPSSLSDKNTYRTEVSYLEIYNERVKDLLGDYNTTIEKSGANSSTNYNLKVREHPQHGPYVENLSKHLVLDFNQISRLMQMGNAVRTTAATHMNDTSSRSHAIFTLTFVKAGVTNEGLPHETVSKIHLVDLAGSERADATGATGQRLKEGAHINKSLVTLGSVISALAADGLNANQQSKQSKSSTRTSTPKTPRGSFIPYRDSVLTWLLKDSLGGNSKTIMIATVSPADVNHGETLSTLRYANRAKNIVNRPTINEDPNVRLIRDLREEIDRLRRAISDQDPTRALVQQRQLAAKEAQERHLTEEWTEKWREAENILKEQKALALKRTTGLGVVLDSDQPHLVGIDEDVLSTGITLYHLKEGDTIIGGDADAADIVLKGPCIEQGKHCTISVDDGVATLVPHGDALCMVNAALVKDPTKLSQGCVVVLGKTNMFRYNDPREAANLRKESNNNNISSIMSNSLLSQSFSDLRGSLNNSSKAHLAVNHSSSRLQASSDGNVGMMSSSQRMVNTSNQSGLMTLSCDDAHALLNTAQLRSDSHTLEEETSNETESVETNSESLFIMSQSTLSEDQPAPIPNDEMNELYKCICEQKEIIVSCLESEHCDLATLNKQIRVLQNMQEHYTRLAQELQARGVWGGDANKAVIDEEQLEQRVEQEVQRRLQEEKAARQPEAEFKELLRVQKERELLELKRQHEKEIYQLKRSLHEAHQRSNASSHPSETLISVRVPRFVMTTSHESYAEYEVAVTTNDATWTVYRRFRQFRELHLLLVQKFGSVVSNLNFPSRRPVWFGASTTSAYVCEERRMKLEAYLNEALNRVSGLPKSPLFCRPSKEALLTLASDFFGNSNRVEDDSNNNNHVGGGGDISHHGTS